MEKLNENRFVIFIYYECRYAQFALSSVIELPRIPAYYPKVSFPQEENPALLSTGNILSRKNIICICCMRSV